MHRLFEIFPRIEGEGLVLREWEKSDAPALAAIVRDDEIYRYLPAGLYERSVPDVEKMIAGAREACFDTRESILLGVCPAEDPGTLMGIGEIYNYEPEKEKASIGCRLAPAWWGQGVAPRLASLLRRYLLEETDVRKITSHVAADNRASCRTMEKSGFTLGWSGLREDWGLGEPVLINKYIYKLTPEEKRALVTK